MPDPIENNGSTDDTSAQEQQDQSQQQDPTPDTGGNGGQQQDQTVDKSTKLPDDHPVVKQWTADKAKLTAARAEIAELRTTSAKVTQLEEELNKRPTTEALETLQTRYDRLEAFLQAAGGPLGKALDSRTFTKQLFETDTDIAQLVKDWHKSNPSATSQALGSSAAAPADKKPDPNTLLRAAIGR